MSSHRGIQARIARRQRETSGDRIRRFRQELGWTQTELCRRANINQGFLSQLERGVKRPSTRMLDVLAVALGVPQAVLVGGGEEHDNPLPLETRELPLFGSIPAGAPSQSQEQLELFPVLLHQWAPHAYCLRLAYDSMEPTLKPGDIVLVHYRPNVEPEHVQGRICACLVDGQPTLKRVSVELRQAQRVVILRGDNPLVPPMLIDGSTPFSIQGIVIKLVSRDL